MSRYIILITSFFCFLAVDLSAQTDKFSKIEIKDISFGIQATLMEIHPAPEGISYGIIANKGTLYSPATMHAHKMDKDFNFVKDYKIANASYKYPYKADSGAEFFTAGGKLKLIYFDDAKTALKIYTSDVEDSSSPRELGQFKIEGRTKGTINALIKSPDRKHFAFLLDVETVDSKELFVLSFDENLSVTGTYKIKQHENNVKHLFSINNEGVLCSFEIYNNGAKKNDPLLFTFAYDLFSNGKAVKSNSVSNIKQLAATATINTDGKNFLVDVLCHREKDVRVDGKMKSQMHYELYHQILDPQLNFIVNTELSISKDKMDDFKSSGKFKARQVNLKGTFPMTDGSAIVLADAHTVNEGNTTFSATGQMDVDKTQYYFTDIMAIHVSPEGNINEVKLFDRVSSGVFYWYMPLVPVVIKDGVAFTYFNNDKETHIIKLGVNSEGTMTVHENVWDQDAMQGRAISQSTLISDGQSTLYALVDHPRKQINLIKITLD